MRSTNRINEDKKKKKQVEPRNFVAKHAPTSGTGVHPDKKKAAKKGEVKHKNKQFNESFDLCETIALIETAMDSIKHPKYGTIWWINHGGAHIIATKSPSGSLEIHALGNHDEIAHKWHNLKSKIHTGSQDIADSMYESFSICETQALLEGTIDSIKHPKYGTIWWNSFGGNAGLHIIASVNRLHKLQIHAVDSQKNISTKWNHLKSKIHTENSMHESATAGSTSSGNIASVANPHLTVGKPNKSYTGTPGQSGTKRPQQPKIKMQTPGTNALDSSANIFGSGTIKRK
jgi:hypothetical protein